MAQRPLASIIVNNYNYARFLREAIDSALNQTYAPTEVIVVDDGSTDYSSEIIVGYGERIVPVLKENGGQNSALNSGFSVCRGEAIFLLDSDDMLLPTAVQAAMEVFCEHDVAKVHWPLIELDAASRETGRVWGTKHRGPSLLKMDLDSIEQEDARELLLREGPDAVPYPPTSGNAFSRRFLNCVFPLPEVKHAGGACEPESEALWRMRPGPDVYLSTLAPLYGRIIRLPEPHACYRVHGSNGYASLGFADRLRFDGAIFEYVSQAVLARFANGQAGEDPGTWRSKSWSHRIQQAAETIAALVPRGDTFILADEDIWGTEPLLAGRRRIPFLERDGYYWGKPSDDGFAIREVQRLRDSGAHFMIFGWPAFWWLDYYTGLHEYLKAKFPCIHEDARILVFDLRSSDTKVRKATWGRCAF